MEKQKEDHVGQLLESMSDSEQAFSFSNGKSKSKAEFVQRVVALSKGLQRQRGLECGERVAIAALNSDCYLEWMLAVPCCGGIIAPLNYRWSLQEAAAAVELVQPVILVVDSHCSRWCQPFRELCPSIQTYVLIGDLKDHISFCINAEAIMNPFMGAGSSLNLSYAPQGVALICFTSGTTGTPKGVSLTHKALIFQSLAKLAVVGYSSMDVYLHTAPLCHIGGISSALAVLMAGSQHVFVPRFEARAVFQALRQYNVSAMIVIPTMLKDLVELSNGSVFPSMSTILNGGGQFPTRLGQHVTKMFPNARLFSAYGMTETTSSITFLEIDTSDFQSTTMAAGVCVGKPVPLVEIHVSDAGSLLTRGPHIMLGYWGHCEDFKQTLSPDGWFDTGDVGRVDELGSVWLLGRAKDMIKTGGQNVYASEVEGVIAQHPSVASIAVVGIPEPRLGELVAAVVVLKQGWRWEEEEEGDNVVSASQLRLHCIDSGLSRYKVPNLFVQQDDPLPMTSTGKLRKDVIKTGITKLKAKL